MLPAVADQVTAVLVVLDTVAVNCWVSPDGTLADVGEMLTKTGATGVPKNSAISGAEAAAPANPPVIPCVSSIIRKVLWC